MNNKQKQVHYANGAAQHFLQDKRKWPESIALLIPVLDAQMAEVVRLVDTQRETRLSDEKTRPTILRAGLRKRLKAISRRGKTLLKGLPGIRDSLRLPPFKATDKVLIDATTRILSHVRPHAEVFAAAAIDVAVFDATERMAADLAAFRARPETARTRRSRATRELKAALSACRETVAEIDAMVELELPRSDVEQWRSVKTVRPIKRPGPKPGSKRPPRPPDAPPIRRRRRRR
jgi:hypothetical protein